MDKTDLINFIESVISQQYTMRMDFILYCLRNQLKNRKFKECTDETIIFDFRSVTRKLSKRGKGYTEEGVVNTINSLLLNKTIIFEAPKGYILNIDCKIDFTDLDL